MHALSPSTPGPWSPVLGPRVAAVVLAAGESSRLGTFKPLLPWPAEDSAERLVAYQVRQLAAAGLDPVIVVIGNRAAEVATVAAAAGATAVYNEDYQTGKAGSVRVGVAAAPEGVPLLIVGVDQPRPAWIFRRLVDAQRRGHPLVIPTFGRRRGHPPIFAACLRGELLTVQEDGFGLRDVIQRHTAAIFHLAFDSPQVLVNLNTPDELAKGRRIFLDDGTLSVGNDVE